MPPILEARRLVKRYAGVRAVEDVSFSIRAGEILGYLGPNGSGKSTTVKMIAGLLEPDSGGVWLHGEPIAAAPAHYKRAIGYVPEQADLYTFLTGWEYLELVATLRAMERAAFERKAMALLGELWLLEHRHSPISSYSKGMRQRIAIIAALMHDPELLILDEPFTGLDVGSTLVMRRVIQLLARAGKAIFFSSPVLEVVEKLCTHVMILRRGQVVGAGSIDEIRALSAQPGLEPVFLHLTEHVDADGIAGNIVSAIRG